MVGERILFGDDGRWSEPLTALLRSAQSRVSSGAPLDVACEDTLTSLHRVVGPRERLRAPAQRSRAVQKWRAPLHGPRSRSARAFARRLDARLNIPLGSRVGVSSQATSKRAPEETSSGARSAQERFVAPTSERRRRRGHPRPTTRRCNQITTKQSRRRTRITPRRRASG